MKGHIDNRFGSIQIEPEVIALYNGCRVLWYCRNGGCQRKGRICKAFKKREPD